MGINWKSKLVLALHTCPPNSSKVHLPGLPTTQQPRSIVIWATLPLWRQERQKKKRKSTSAFAFDTCIMSGLAAMRNLEVTKCLVLPPAALLSEVQCFCLDCDRGTVWVVTRNDLCCIEDGKVTSLTNSMYCRHKLYYLLCMCCCFQT